MKALIKENKLWIYCTIFFMSFNGGYINAICLTSVLKNPVGYITGNLALAGEMLSQRSLLLFFELIALVICFLIGSILGGFLSKEDASGREKGYYFSLVFLLVLMINAIFAYQFSGYIVGYLLALAMGLQNSITTHYGTSLVRTTHMTGTMTDLGLLLGRWLKGGAVEAWKVALYSVLILSFTIGALMGAYFFFQFGIYALLFSIIIYVLMIFL